MTTQIPVSVLQQFTVPKGGIILWSGSEASIPSGWALCNGSNGTPDLRGRFIVGSSASYAQGTSGGSATKTLTESNMPSHSHTGTTTAGEGAHTHTVTDPGHQHAHTRSFTGNNNILYHPNDVNKIATGLDNATNGTGAIQSNTTGITINSTNSAHTHTFTTDSKGSGTAFDILPPYYALAYIMKL